MSLFQVPHRVLAGVMVCAIAFCSSLVLGQKIYWVESDPAAARIVRADTNGSNAEDLLVRTLGSPTRCAVDSTAGLLYWMDPLHGTVVRASLSGGAIESVAPAGSSFDAGIALDRAGGKIYWCSDDSIRRANLDGGNMETLIDTLGDPSGVAVDPIAGKVYYIHDYHRVSRANLDGSESEDVLSLDEEEISFLAIDPTGGMIYFSGGGEDCGKGSCFGLIRRAHLDGSQLETLVITELTNPPIALDLSTGLLYWIDGGVRRANLDGSGSESLGIEEMLYPDGIAVDETAGNLYWTESWSPRIRRMSLNDITVEDVFNTSVALPIAVALDPVNFKMYWIEGNGFEAPEGIRRANLDGSSNQHLASPTVILPRHIQVDSEGGFVYWAGLVDPVVERAPINGGDPEVIALPIPDWYDISGFAVDSVNEKIYWSASPVRVIQRANLDGSGFQALVSLPLGMTPQAVALDVAGGKLYWIAHSFGTGQGKIQRANLDGTNVETLVPTGLIFPTGLALDLPSGKMYWSDDGNQGPGTDGTVQRANLDGSNVETVASGYSIPRGVAISSAPHIMASDPPTCAIDARQPHSLTGSNPAGWSSTTLTFSGDVTNATSSDFNVSVDPPGETPHIGVVFAAGNTVTVQFGDAIEETIPPGHWTMVTHLPSGTSTRLGFLPGDVNNDGVSSPVDILKLIDHLNGVVEPPYQLWQTDMNRSGVAEPSDVLRVIDLLNGADAFDLWLSRSLPTCPLP